MSYRVKRTINTTLAQISLDTRKTMSSNFSSCITYAKHLEKKLKTPGKTGYASSHSGQLLCFQRCACSQTPLRYSHISFRYLQSRVVRSSGISLQMMSHNILYPRMHSTSGLIPTRHKTRVGLRPIFQVDLC